MKTSLTNLTRLFSARPNSMLRPNDLAQVQLQEQEAKRKSFEAPLTESQRQNIIQDSLKGGPEHLLSNVNEKSPRLVKIGDSDQKQKILEPRNQLEAYGKSMSSYTLDRVSPVRAIYDQDVRDNEPTSLAHGTTGNNPLQKALKHDKQHDTSTFPLSHGQVIPELSQEDKNEQSLDQGTQSSNSMEDSTEIYDPENDKHGNFNMQNDPSSPERVTNIDLANEPMIAKNLEMRKEYMKKLPVWVKNSAGSNHVVADLGVSQQFGAVYSKNEQEFLENIHVYKVERLAGFAQTPSDLHVAAGEQPFPWEQDEEPDSEKWFDNTVSRNPVIEGFRYKYWCLLAKDISDKIASDAQFLNINLDAAQVGVQEARRAELLKAQKALEYDKRTAGGLSKWWRFGAQGLPKNGKDPKVMANREQLLRNWYLVWLQFVNSFDNILRVAHAKKAKKCQLISPQNQIGSVAKRNYLWKMFEDAVAAIRATRDVETQQMKNKRYTFKVVSLPTHYQKKMYRLEKDVNEDFKFTTIKDDLPKKHPLYAYKGWQVDAISVDGGKSFIDCEEYKDLQNENVAQALTSENRRIRLKKAKETKAIKQMEDEAVVRNALAGEDAVPNGYQHVTLPELKGVDPSQYSHQRLLQEIQKQRE